MDEIKKQPIDKRTLLPFYTRLVLATLVLAGVLIALHKLLPDIMKRLELSEHTDLAQLAAPITACLMYIRYIRSTCNRKWGYAFVVYVYDVMSRADSSICPRCKTRLDKDFSDLDFMVSEPKSEVQECSCPNTNCGLSLQNKMSFSQCPSTRKGLKAFVLNLGIKSDYSETLVSRIFNFILALAVSGALASIIVVKVLPLVADLL